ncbi:type II secretion system F family protein [Candidatus Woesearchaeota archaeon]|nr:type II secretion system F family protein [Candidatus Woesearchaeota archaeon]
MRIDFKLKHIIGLSLGIVIILLDFILFRGTRLFQPALGIGVFVSIFMLWLDIITENKRQAEIEFKFLEFVRALVETIKSGIPIPKAILHIGNADYGALSPYVRKLANQVEWGMPLREALETFARDTNNRVIIRSISIVMEAERSGGNISEVLSAVTMSILQIKKIKDERKSNTYSQMVQGYFIFFVFIIIMLVLQIYLMPQLADISGTIAIGVTGGFEAYLEGDEVTTQGGIDFDSLFLSLTMIQGFFAGIMIGKFAEGELKRGLKHSLIVMIISYLIITTVRGI